MVKIYLIILSVQLHENPIVEKCQEEFESFKAQIKEKKKLTSSDYQKGKLLYNFIYSTIMFIQNVRFF